MASSLRGSISSTQCWFIDLNAEYVFAITIVGIFPVLTIIVLYGSILFKAMKNIDELKSATNPPIDRGASNSTRLRYFKGSTVNILLNQSTSAAASTTQEADNEELATLHGNQRASSKSILNCLSCFRWRKNDEINDDSNQSNRQPSKWKAIKVVMFTTGAFMVTWIPYFVASTMFVYCDHEKNANFCDGLKTAIASPLAILGFTNSLLNPIIYAWWHTGFRTKSISIYSKRMENVKCCSWIFAKRSQTQSGATNPSSSGTSVDL